MQDLNEFLQTTNYRPVFSLGIALSGAVICFMVLISLLHTLQVAGQRTPLYQKRQPVEGWNRRFYPATGIMIIFLLMLMWLLNVWSHRLYP